MTNPNQEPDAAASIRALLAKWREQAKDRMQPTKRKDVHIAGLYGSALRRCADELEALLASPPPVSPTTPDVHALVTALEFAKGAIQDAICLEDGLDGLAGEAVIKMIDAALKVPPVSPSPQESTVGCPLHDDCAGHGERVPLRASERSDGVERQDLREVPNEKAPCIRIGGCLKRFGPDTACLCDEDSATCLCPEHVFYRRYPEEYRNAIQAAVDKAGSTPRVPLSETRQATGSALHSSTLSPSREEEGR